MSSNPLETCPAEQRDRYASRARRAASGSRASAIQLKCLECCGWSMPEAKRCTITDCALWRYGFAARKATEGEAS